MCVSRKACPLEEPLTTWTHAAKAPAAFKKALQIYAAQTSLPIPSLSPSPYHLIAAAHHPTTIRTFLYIIASLTTSELIVSNRTTMSGHTYDHCIAVIGAGAAGLAAAKALLAEGFNVTIFERKTGPGGLWNTAPGTGCWPNPVYEGLETNVPRTLMTLSDFPWPTNASLFPTSSCVHQYLQQYLLDMQQSDNGQARLMVWYNTEVTGLRKSTCDKTPCWRIESTERPFGRNPVEKFSQWSAVIVAIGNYHKRWIPQEFLEELGMWDAVFPASLFHSINYRTPEPFRDQVRQA